MFLKRLLVLSVSLCVAGSAFGAAGGGRVKLPHKSRREMTQDVVDGLMRYLELHMNNTRRKALDSRLEAQRQLTGLRSVATDFLLDREKYRNQRAAQYGRKAFWIEQFVPEEWLALPVVKAQWGKLHEEDVLESIVRYGNNKAKKSL
jgi:hypothetical protein